jgi:hypothetical protein
MRRMAQELDIFELMRTQRAMRRLKPDPVPEEGLGHLAVQASWR